jgi:hypothetical protein
MTESQAKRVKQANKGWVTDHHAVHVAIKVGVDKVVSILEAQSARRCKGAG